MNTYAENHLDLPYYQIPEQSKIYTAGTVVGRLIDGLGFRYYWASEGLTVSDLEFKLNPDACSTLETMIHIYNLSTIIRDVALKEPHIKEEMEKALTYDELRAQTLNNLKAASDIFKQATDLEQYPIIFRSSNGDRTIPFWNAINGPIEDCVWHCGQIASYRRASGNPISSNISHLTGTVKV